MSRSAGVTPFPDPADRLARLEARRDRKMARSAHAYVRGSTAQFYQWLREIDHSAVPAAPDVWICGDCHIGNLGPTANAAGRVHIQIRDLDQTVLGNPAHDLIRLGLSLSAAARGSNLPGIATAHMLEQVIHGYRDALDGHDESLSEARAGKAVRAVIAEATHRRWRHLALERLDRVEPKIPLGKRFWPLSAEELHAVERLVSSEAAAAVIGTVHGRGTHQDVTVVDAAYWVKGCSSLGTLRYAVLLRIGGGKDGRSYCLLDIKEAVASVAPTRADHAVDNNARRVVTGARALSPYLGDRMLPATLLGRSVVVRELMPQDLKLEMDQLTPREAVEAARFLAAVVGHAHARQMDADARRRWSRELMRDHTRELDAPLWMWGSIVELVGRHERAYLDHCRLHAGAA
ncbi:DUF2252 family protein [Lichenihabitans sp. Uapishka_5]|uniref:DUF2252 family protein n=1 Tax=Lichenihabitans sp. Uapishka_5 TaxID=3037302 RepID=UPI0029E82762|nr:DUF2252 family protein [Lichenihabitans sp. Uapishka_5]MDX7951690.1 DUF2252 family protein [Lichenihabitans sp. Uapishka_5]